MLKYNRVHNNLVFENIPTMPLGLHAGTEIKRHQNLDKDNLDFSEESFSQLSIVNRVNKHSNSLNVKQMQQRELEIFEGL